MDILVKDLKYAARKNMRINVLAERLASLIHKELENDAQVIKLDYKVETKELYIIDEVIEKMGLQHKLYFTELGEAFTTISLLNLYENKI